MKKWCLLILLFPVILMAETTVEYFMGEMRCQMCEEEVSEHFGFLFLKRTFIPDESCFIDRCLITSRDGETLEIEQTSNLRGDLHEIVLSDSEGMISGHGELVGFPWHWTQLQERLRLAIESPVEVDVKNTMEGETMFSMARVFTLESDGSREFFGTFSTELYRVDAKRVESFFHP